MGTRGPTPVSLPFFDERTFGLFLQLIAVYFHCASLCLYEFLDCRLRPTAPRISSASFFLRRRIESPLRLSSLNQSSRARPQRHFLGI